MNDIYINELKKQIPSSYQKKLFSEEQLRELAAIIQREEADLYVFIQQLFEMLVKDGNQHKCLDWNIGSTLQHFNPITVIEAFKALNGSSLCHLYNSIGVAWVLGEFNIRDGAILEFLRKMVEEDHDSDVWWRAAFSLEKLGQGDAIHYLKKTLKSKGIRSLEYYFDHIGDKRSVIGILVLSNNQNIKEMIYPRIKETFLHSEDLHELISCAWLLGRFRLSDKELISKMESIIEKNENYELVYYTFFAIFRSNLPVFYSLYKKYIACGDALLRKMAVRGISYLEGGDIFSILEEALDKERDEGVISEICQAIYRVNNNQVRMQVALEKAYCNIENGLIIDDSDKWYATPSIYEVFSKAEDPENICFKAILREINTRLEVIENPVDLACGTGRAMDFFIDKIDYRGSFYAVDRSSEMLNFLQKKMDRRHLYTHMIEYHQSELAKLELPVRSNLMISSFGFPSQFTDKEQCMLELQRVDHCPLPGGLFITLGWDETFNDALSNFWYQHIPDNINAKDFETWRLQRMKRLESPRNCNLTWYKTKLLVPLLFYDVREAAYIMGYLFGRDAADEVIRTNRTRWQMSLGITINTKEEISLIIKKYKNERN